MTKLHDWTPEAVERIRGMLEETSPLETLRWGLNTFGDDLVMATGFGPSGIVLAHHLSVLDRNNTVFYLDTGLLFSETHALREQLTERLGLTFQAVHPELTVEQQAVAQGPDLWERNPNQCCFLRKVLPLRRFLADKAAWITGLRRDQSAVRAQTGVIEWDAAHGLVKLNPLAAWTTEEVWAYIHFHELPYNALHDEGYPSIGCRPCTRPVASGEDQRGGRWRGFDKTECGIHLPLASSPSIAA